MFWFFWFSRDKDSDGRASSMIPVFSVFSIATLGCLIIFIRFCFISFRTPEVLMNLPRPEKSISVSVRSVTPTAIPFYSLLKMGRIS